MLLYNDILTTNLWQKIYTNLSTFKIWLLNEQIVTFYTNAIEILYIFHFLWDFSSTFDQKTFYHLILLYNFIKLLLIISFKSWKTFSYKYRTFNKTFAKTLIRCFRKIFTKIKFRRILKLSFAINKNILIKNINF